MAKDDYFVIVYQILAYLYQCLKNDIPVDVKVLMPRGKLFSINDNYWKYIITNMYEQGYITGLTMTKVFGGDYPIISDLERSQITPKGIEYLCENSLLEKAKKLLKDIKEITPFI